MAPATPQDVILACVLLAIISIARLSMRSPFEGPFRG